MKSLSDPTRPKSFALLLYGPPGGGKTTLAMQFPAPWFLNCDNNLDGPERYLRSKGCDLSAVRYDSPIFNDDWTEVPEAQRWTRAKQLVEAAVRSPDVRTIVIDSATTFEMLLQAELLRVAGKKEITQPMWGEIYRAWAEYITKLRYASGKLVIFIAHERTERDELDGSVKAKLAIQGSIQDKAGALFTDMWRASALEVQGKTVWNVRVAPTPRYEGLKTSLLITDDKGQPLSSFEPTKPMVEKLVRMLT